MLTLPNGYKISGNQVIEKRTGEVVPGLYYDSSDKVFILENQDGTTSRNISQTKLTNHIDAFEQSRRVGQNLAAPAQTDPSAKAKKEVKSFTKFLDDTKEQLAISKGTLVSYVSSQPLTHELKHTVTESINAVYDQLIAIIDAKKAEIESATDVNAQAKHIKNDSTWQQRTETQVEVLNGKLRNLVDNLNDPTKSLSIMRQVEKAFTKLKESLISLLQSASKDGFNSNPLEALNTVLQSLDAQLPTSNSERVELTDEEKETLLNVKVDRVFELLLPHINPAKVIRLDNSMDVPTVMCNESVNLFLDILKDVNNDSKKIHQEFYTRFVQYINRWGGIKRESRPKAEAIERFLREQGFTIPGFLYGTRKKS